MNTPRHYVMSHITQAVTSHVFRTENLALDGVTTS